MIEDEARRRVRQLLLSGDNTLKNRTGDERVARARSRYESALAVAREARLDDAVVFAQRRLDALDRD
ncbi:MAG TPA: hypothetical protein VK951_04155 [Miltoncostaeaceae bacterium]|nr:hypothetical protein [Miltoncostaeaceae bacterium]